MATTMFWMVRKSSFFCSSVSRLSCSTNVFSANSCFLNFTFSFAWRSSYPAASWPSCATSSRCSYVL